MGHKSKRKVDDIHIDVGLVNAKKNRENQQKKLAEPPATKKHRPDDQNFIDCFYGLAETDQIRRNIAAYQISSMLSADDVVKTTLNYSVDRLVKGISSSRLAARLGYATTLVETLRVLPDFKFLDLVTQIEKTLPLSETKEDPAGSRIIGHSLCIIALWKCGRCNLDECKTLADKLHSIYKENAGLRHFLIRSLLSLIQSLDSEQDAEAVFPSFFKELRSLNLDQVSADQLWAILEIGKKFPGIFKSASVRVNPRDAKFRGHIARLIKSSCQGLTVHPVWRSLVGLMLRGKNEEMFPQFWWKRWRKPF